MAIDVIANGLDEIIEVAGLGELTVIEDHNALRNRDMEDQHPMSAIDGLEGALSGKAPVSHTHEITDVDGLTTALSGKQDELTAGDNITIIDNVISATGGGGGAVDSVNGKTGDVVLDAEDVGALPDTTAIPTDLADLSDDATHRLVTDAEKSTWSGKQDAISDLASIRTNAGKGATAIQADDYAGGSTAGVVKTSSTYGVGTNGSGYLYGLIIPTAQYGSSNSNAIVSKGTLDNQNFVSDGSYVHTDNNYTTAEKSKVATALQPASLNPYRTSQAQDAIDTTKVDKIQGKGLSTNDYSDAEKEKVAETKDKIEWLSIIDGKINIAFEEV